MKKLDLLFVFLFFIGAIGFSQNQPITHFSTENILPHNTVRSLLVTNDGALWIGTDNGLARKFNASVQHFFEEDGLPMNNIWALAEDESNTLWIGSYGNGIAYFDGKNFTKLSAENNVIHPEIITLFVSGNYLYAGTSNGISIVDIPGKKVVSSFKSSENNPMRIHEFFEFEGVIFSATYNSGLYKIEKNNTGFSFQKITDKYPIYATQKMGDSLFLSHKETFSSTSLPDLIKKQEPNFMESDGPSIFWDFEVAQEKIFAAAWGIFEETGGLFQFSKDKIKRIPGISCRQLTSLAYHPELNFLYVGSLQKGVYQLDLNEKITFYPAGHQRTIDLKYFNQVKIRLYNDGLAIADKEYPAAFFKQKQRNYVLANPSNLPKHEDFFYELNYDTPVSDIVFYGIKNSQTHIWINTSIGLYKFLPDGNFDGYLPLHTLAFDFTPDNRLIETNPYHGVRVYNKENTLEYTYYEENLAKTPTDVVGTLRTEKHTFFLSVFEGLFSYDNTFKSYTEENLWKEKKLRFATEYKDGIAVTQEFGDIFILEVHDQFNVKEKIPRQSIKGKTLSTLNSYLDWLIVSTEKGLTFLNGDKRIIVDQEQGLDKPVYASTVYKDTLFLGTDGGEFRMDLPALLHPKNRLDSVYVTTFLVNNSKITTASENLKLKAKQNNIKIFVETNAHPFPEKLSFQYKMKQQADWQDLDFQEIELYFLEPSHYEVSVRVRDASTGHYLEQKILAFTILPPVYAQWWFLILSGMVIISGGYVFFNYKKRQQEKRAAKEIAFNKQIEKLKTDALLAQMNPHFIFNALNSLQHLVVLEENEKASAYLVKFAKLVRTNLNNAERTYTSLHEELSYLKTYCEIENERHGNRIRINFDISSEIQPADIEIPTMVLQPFIENAFVHAFPPAVSNPQLTLSAKPASADFIQYTIEDNGIGNQKVKKSPTRESKGIRLIKERLQFLGYDAEKAVRIEHWENGTKVTLIL